MYKNNMFTDREEGYIYFIKFNKNFVKQKYIMGYEKYIDLGYGKGSIKIGSTHNKFRIHNIAQELYPDDDLGIENIEILRVIKCKQYRELESFIHNKYKDKRDKTCTFKREYFSITDEDVFSEDYTDFGYIGEYKTMRVVYTQLLFFLKIVNACTANKYWKDKMISYNNLLSSTLNL